MKPKDFFDLVTLMRKSQREFFKTRSNEALRQSKALEKQVDIEIERVNNILSEQSQPRLFK